MLIKEEEENEQLKLGESTGTDESKKKKNTLRTFFQKSRKVETFARLLSP